MKTYDTWFSAALCSFISKARLIWTRESSKRVTRKGGLRCERFDRTVSVALKTLSPVFYRAFSGAKRVSWNLFRGSIESLVTCFFSATLILSKSSRVLDSKSRRKSAKNQPKFDSKLTKNQPKSQLKSSEWGLFMSHLRWWERAPNFWRVRWSLLGAVASFRVPLWNSP